MDKEIKKYIEGTIRKIVDERLSEREKKINLICWEMENFLSDKYD